MSLYSKGKKSLPISPPFSFQVKYTKPWSRAFSFNNEFSNLLNGKVINKWWILKDAEGYDHDLFQRTTRHSSEGAEENHKESQDNQCPSRDSNKLPPKYKLESFRNQILGAMKTYVGVEVSSRDS